MLKVVDVELTPNPHALKFLLTEKILKFTSRHFATPAEAEVDPLAKGIFEIEGVVSVFYSDRFITIEKEPKTEWGKIQRPFISFLQEFNTALIPVEEIPTLNEAESNELLKQIYDVLQQKVMPALAYDGGGLEVLGLDGLTLKVKYQGACGSCPSATRGTLQAIESLLRRDVNPSIEVIPA